MTQWQHNLWPDIVLKMKNEKWKKRHGRKEIKITTKWNRNRCVLRKEKKKKGKWKKKIRKIEKIELKKNKKTKKKE